MENLPRVEYGFLCAKMATRSYRPGERAPITDGSQVMGEDVHKIAVDQLIPRIAERNKKAVETVPLQVYFFQAIRAGRRCSCWDIEASPDGQCVACFGTGFVGGFEKYGTTIEVIDITRGSLRMSNILPDWTKRRKPTPFQLISGATKGSVEARIHLTSNIGLVDALAARYERPAGSTIKAFVRAPSDNDYTDLTKNNIKQRLFNPWIDIKFELYRTVPDAKSPIVKTIYLRYQNFTDNTITVNIPRVQKSIALQEMGIVDDYSPIHFWSDNKLRSITTEDFFISAEGDTRWKVLTVQDFAPHGQLTSWDWDMRLVQEHEPYRLVPA